jgi:hypothetical protein
VLDRPRKTRQLRVHIYLPKAPPDTTSLHYKPQGMLRQA